MTRILFWYLAGRFCKNFLFCLFGVLALFYVLELVELQRRVADHDNLVLTDVFWLAAMKLTGTYHLVLPFVVLFGAMLSFWQFLRAQELVVMRSAGLTNWRLLWPVFFMALALGVVQILILDAIASPLYQKYLAIEDHIFHNQSVPLTLERNGLWLRENNADGSQIIYGRSAQLQESSPQIEGETIENLELGLADLQERVRELRLMDVRIWFFDPEGYFSRRIDAPQISLQQGRWYMPEARQISPDGRMTTFYQMGLPTSLSVEDILTNFAVPETLSIWRLSHFIDRLRLNNFSATAYELHFYNLLTTPFLWGAMTLFAGLFIFRPVRGHKILGVFIGSILAVLTVFVLGDIAKALAENSRIPVMIAGVFPGILSLCIGATAIFFHEHR